MGCFTVKPWALVVLLGVLAVITLVLVLPQVDLQDTAFQRDTSPLALRSLGASAPLVSASAALFRFSLGMGISLRSEDEELPIHALLSEPLQTLKHSLRC
jgi:hypothetical protein